MGLLEELSTAARRRETPCGDGRMVWHEWNPAGGAPAVLLHGGNGSWRHWARLIPRLARTHRVIAADLPGLGESALPEGVDDPAGVAAIVAKGLRLLEPDTARLDLVGFSYGAMVGGIMAATLPAPPRSLAILGAGALGVARTPTPLQKIRDKAGEARVAAHRANLASLMIHDPARIDALALEMQEWHTVHARFRSRGFATATLLRDALARTAMPLLAAWGEHDQIAVPHLDRRITAVREVRPDARIEVIPDAGHWVMYEAAEAVGALLEDWLPR
jgi:pimeloyl-ACP methyl ester carboxylesterase